MTTYMLVDGESNEITDGLQAVEARRWAQRIANERGEPVWLSETYAEEPGQRFDPEVETCECGTATGHACSGILAEDAMVVEWMPEQHRSSHEAAGNRGVWPHNGALQLRATPECADALLLDTDWAELVEASR